jgi:hypothetical protein
VNRQTDFSAWRLRYSGGHLMSKSRDARKDSKKKPAKSLKEKRKEKQQKKQEQ